MKNTLTNMILVLGGITLVASAAVGLVYRVTKEPIRLAQEANARLALGNILPDFDHSTTDTLMVDGIEAVIYTATRRGELVGHAVQTSTMRGFSGEIRMMVGFTPDGKVYNIKVLDHAETPGFGDIIAEDDNPLFRNFEGRRPSQMRLAVTKDGGDVDALTGATITSRAYVDAVARAYNALTIHTGGQELGGDAPDAATGATTPVDTATGATTPDGQSGATTLDSVSGATATDSASDTSDVSSRNRVNKRKGGMR